MSDASPPLRWILYKLQEICRGRSRNAYQAPAELSNSGHFPIPFAPSTIPPAVAADVNAPHRQVDSAPRAHGIVGWGTVWGILGLWIFLSGWGFLGFLHWLAIFSRRCAGEPPGKCRFCGCTEWNSCRTPSGDARQVYVDPWAPASGANFAESCRDDIPYATAIAAAK